MKKLFALALVCLFIFSGFLALPQTKAQIVGSGSIDSGLVGYWRLDDGSGTSAVDSSGNGHTGTLVNSPSWTTGKFNDGLQFNGVSSFINISDVASLELTGNLTISAWINIPSIKHGVIACKYWDNEYEFAITANAALEFDHHGISLVSPNNVVSVNSWVFVSVTRDITNQSITFFVNGYKVGATQGFVSLPTTGTRNLIIGAENPSPFYNFFNGTIDDVRIYNRALSSSEISTLYNGLSVSVTYDLGSTVTPNGTVLVGVDQSQTFVSGALSGYAPSTIWLDGLPNAPISVFAVSVQANRTLYITSQYIGGGPTNTPGPTAIPTVTSSPIGLTELVILIVFLCFTLLAFITKDQFIFGFAGLISMGFGVDLSLIYVGDNSSWLFLVIGVGLIFFGIYLFLVALQFAMKKGGNQK